MADAKAKRKRIEAVSEEEPAPAGGATVAWIHGHTHKSDVYEWTCAGRVTPVLNVGSPFYASADVDGRLHFAVVRLGNRWLEAVDVSVVPSSPTAYEIPGHTTLNTSGDYNPDATWGGWAVRYPIDPPVP